MSVSLFAPGYTIASVIANEFTEATGNVYRSSLVEMGFVLFLITIIVNALARLLVLATSRKGTAHAHESPGRRKLMNYVMLTATGLCAFTTVSVLFVILGYLVYNGGKSLDWNFLPSCRCRRGNRRRNGQRYCRKRNHGGAGAR